MNMKVKLLVFLVLFGTASGSSATLWDGKQPDVVTRLNVLTEKLEKIFADEGNAPEQARRLAVTFRQIISPAFLKLQEETLKDIYVAFRTRNLRGEVPSKIIALEGLVSLLGTHENIPSLRTLEEISLNVKKLNTERLEIAKKQEGYSNIRMPIVEALLYLPVLNFIQAIQLITDINKTPSQQDQAHFYNIVRLLVTALQEEYEDQIKDDLLLFYAKACSKAGSVEKAKKYLKMGANPNYVGRQGGSGTTPLIHAIENDNLEMTKTLLEAGADPNLSYAGTPLSIATQMVTNKKVDKAIVEILKMHGARMQPNRGY